MSFANCWQLGKNVNQQYENKICLHPINNLHPKSFVKHSVFGSLSLLKDATDSLTCSDCTVHSVSDRRSA